MSETRIKLLYIFSGFLLIACAKGTMYLVDIPQHMTYPYYIP